MEPKIYRGLVLSLFLTASSWVAAGAQMAWREEGPGWDRPHRFMEEAEPQGKVTAERFDDGQEALESGHPIRAIWGRAGDIVDALQSLNGREAMPFHGGDGGGAWGFRIESGDYLAEVHGYFGNWYGHLFISQLSFVTAKGRVYGPFGKNNGVQGAQRINLVAPPGRQIIAFTGSTDEAPEADGSVSTYLSSLGAVFEPMDWAPREGR